MRAAFLQAATQFRTNAPGATILVAPYDREMIQHMGQRLIAPERGCVAGS